MTSSIKKKKKEKKIQKHSRNFQAVETVNVSAFSTYYYVDLDRAPEDQNATAKLVLLSAASSV